MRTDRRRRETNSIAENQIRFGAALLAPRALHQVGQILSCERPSQSIVPSTVTLRYLHALQYTVPWLGPAQAQMLSSVAIGPCSDCFREEPSQPMHPGVSRFPFSCSARPHSYTSAPFFHASIGWPLCLDSSATARMDRIAVSSSHPSRVGHPLQIDDSLQSNLNLAILGFALLTCCLIAVANVWLRPHTVTRLCRGRE